MLESRLTEAHVRAAIAALEVDDPAMGRLADDSWMSLTAGEGPAMVSLANLQNWLWWSLPKQSAPADHDRWIRTAAAVGTLFERLGAPAHAAVCRSETTARVLGAWRTSRSKGMAASRAALRASPVEPPDLADFAWGTTYGTWESDARGAVEVALEEALGDGRIETDARGWRKEAAAICRATIDEEHPSGIGQSWRSLVHCERAAHWAGGPRLPAELRADRERVANRFLSPPPPPSPEVAAGPLGRLAWLAAACADGVTLTSSGYLPRTLVVAGAEHYGWWDWDKPPRSEADVWELRLVHRAARQLGIVRRRGRILTTTRAGHSLPTEPDLWWPQLVRLGRGDDAYRDAIFEETALALIDGDTHRMDDLGRLVGRALSAQGWQSAAPTVSTDDHGHCVYRAVNPWRVWGFVEYRPSRWVQSSGGPRELEPATVTATPAGRAAAALWLHGRITGPRHGL